MTDEEDLATEGNPTFMLRKFEIEHQSDARTRAVRAHTYTYLQRTIINLKDGTRTEYGKEDDPEQPFYSLIIDTDIGFAEALETFKKIGVTGKALISTLTYAGNHVKNMHGGILDKVEKTARGEQDLDYTSRSEYHAGQLDEKVRYHNTSFVVADLDAAFIKDIDQSEGPMFIRIDSPKSPVTDEFPVTYHRQKTEDGLNIMIGYMDNKIVRPRFDDLIDTAAFEVSEDDRLLLEDMITRAMKL